MLSKNEMEHPKISILVPAYNHESYILDSLNSVLEETYPNKELVIIDDGSTDRTTKIILAWVKENESKLNIIYKARHNKGVTSTFNELISLANGEYLRLFSSDDLLIKGGLKHQMDFLLSHPLHKAVLSECQVINEKGSFMYSSSLCEFGRADKSNYVKDLKYAIIIDWNVYGPGLLINKEFLEKIGKYNDNLFIDDWDLYLRLVSSNSLIFLDKKVGMYRVHSSSTCRDKTSQTRIRNLQEKCQIINNRKNLFNYVYGTLLFSELSLTKSKINFLKRNFFKASLYFSLSKVCFLLFFIIQKVHRVKYDI